MIAPGDPTNSGQVPYGYTAPSANITQLIGQLLQGGAPASSAQLPSGISFLTGGSAQQSALAPLLEQMFGGAFRPAQQQQAPLSNAGDAGYQRGAPGATGGRNGRFVWGDRTWGPNDFNAFASFLKSRGADIGTWARMHPQAFASFNVDPNFKQAILAQGAPPSALGGRAPMGGV